MMEFGGLDKIWQSHDALPNLSQTELTLLLIQVVATSLPNSSTDNLAILGINIASLRHEGTVRDIVCLILTGLIRLEYGTLPYQLSSSSLMARHYLPMILGKVNIDIHPDFERPMLFAEQMAEVFVAG
ncbi:hypothetical protein FVEG_01864 [Fusarium verticillioides 7600]|uniref:Uncharacterized protein n=1 Tax=Gibberella moniliformis (strain M3125 / FGSC 7600) TaxID=334819 RepID=W7LJN9_GIBM7|nr:hypothetical protein FVEG_01864 [Fusarium verticillioides 7600]EWG38706.1 hypothetical protein FVEG_01864 [Fusarium verticillioides 7600]RBQ69876.1 hypothetical protein FVER14953_01864 [Fusarium verticillioides]RBQ92486.1 hypothetical protein FVER53263_01864 [Fusarium verticillioides]RBR18450.1 hypothetical protein FVER53590_01864 [Fusarium verticillioides]